jgi:alpha-mannosidase
MVTANFETTGVVTVDLLERPVTEAAMIAETDAAQFTLRPFQLVTLRFGRK